MYEVKQLREQLSRLKQERSNLEYEWARVLLLVQPNRSLANSFIVTIQVLLLRLRLVRMKGR